MISSQEKDEFQKIKSNIKRKSATAKGGRRKRHSKPPNFDSTRWETTKNASSPKLNMRATHDLSIYKDDYYEKRNISPGFKWNTSYLGNEIRDNSWKPSAPKYSIGKASREKIIDKSELKNFDVGSTSPEPDKYIKRNSPKAVIGNKIRFKETYKRYKLNKKVPHSYLKNLKEILGTKSRDTHELKQQTISNPINLGVAVSIPKSTRFSNYLNTGPGPADYTINASKSYTSIYTAPRKFRVKSAHPNRRQKINENRQNLVNSFTDDSRNDWTFGHSYKHGKKIWFEEVDNTFLNKESPGPAKYTPNENVMSIHSNVPSHKFSTASRWNVKQGKFRLNYFSLEMLIQENSSKSPYHNLKGRSNRDSNISDKFINKEFRFSKNFKGLKMSKAFLRNQNSYEKLK